VSYLPVNNSGNLNLTDLTDTIDDGTVLVSVMFANNETGVIFPVETISNMTKERGVLFHTDAVQAAGKIAIDVKQIPVTCSAYPAQTSCAQRGGGTVT